MAKKQVIRLTEADVHEIINNSVRMILENEEDELFGGLGALASRAGRGIANGARKVGQAVSNAARNVANTYQAGERAANIRKIAQQKQQFLQQCQQVASSQILGRGRSTQLLTQLIQALSQEIQQAQGQQQRTM